MSANSPITRAAEWHRWEHKRLRIENTQDGEPFDLTDHNLRFVLKQRPGSALALLTKTTEEGITVENDDDDNVAVVDIAVEDYENLPADLYYYELWDDSDALQLSYGRALLQQGVEPEGS